MAPLRSLLVLLILLGLVGAATAVAQAPVEWYTEDSGGGAVAGPAPDLHGGGAIAPLNPRVPATVNLPPPTDVPAPSDSPPAQAARAPATETDDTPAPAPAAQSAAAAQAAPDSAPAAEPGPLPFTGLELAVVAAAGLCLLLAGFALRPRAARR